MAIILIISSFSTAVYGQKDDGIDLRETSTYLTVINVLTPKPGEQDKIVKLLTMGMQKSMQSVPGFISATVHKSLDNELVVVYAQWKDSESLNGAAKLIQEGKAPEMAEVFTNATPNYHPYTVFSCVSTDGGNAKAYIKENPDYLTVINVITPKKGEQDSVVELLKTGMLESMRHRDGFISAVIHKSLDNDLITVYAQWDSADALGKAAQYIQDGNAPEMVKAFTKATPDYHPYEVVSSTHMMGKENPVTLKENEDSYTVINVVTPKKGEQQKVVGLLNKGITESMQYVDGFKNATIHQSLDSDLVTVYAQWTSKEALSRAYEYVKAGKAPAMLKVFSNASTNDHPYEIVANISGKANKKSRIVQDDNHITMINVITPKKGKQEELIALLKEGLSESMSKVDGFLNATIHKSLDNENVIVYAQWESLELQQKSSEIRASGKAPSMAKVFDTSRPDSHSYKVVSLIKAKR